MQAFTARFWRFFFACLSGCLSELFTVPGRRKGVMLAEMMS
jgi:hypothetical protein